MVGGWWSEAAEGDKRGMEQSRGCVKGGGAWEMRGSMLGFRGRYKLIFDLLVYVYWFSGLRMCFSCLRSSYIVSPTRAIVMLEMTP